MPVGPWVPRRRAGTLTPARRVRTRRATARTRGPGGATLTSTPPRDVCFFGELDPYTGSVPQRAEHLPALVRTLKLLCLLHDAVILPPGSLLEHALALPSFEALAPLVRAGRLGTSADHRAPAPPRYFTGRIEAAVASHRGAAELGAWEPRWRRAELHALQDRWLALLPPRWPLRRTLAAQVGGLDTATRRGLQGLARTGARLTAELLLRFVDQLADRDEPLHRDLLIARIGGLRGNVAPTDVQRAAAIVQGYYLTAGIQHQDVGASAGGRCRLFPGPFTGHLAALRPLGAVPEVPYDLDLLPPRVRARARRIGVDLDALVRLPASDVLALAETGWWGEAQRILRGDAAPPERERDLGARLHGRDVRDGPRIWAADTTGAARPAPTVLPPRWQQAAQALLGSGLAPAPDVPPARPPLAAFDWPTRRLHVEAEPPRPIPPTPAHLLTVLVIAGDGGLPVSDLKRALVDLDRVADGLRSTRGPPSARTAQDQALRDRLDVERHLLDRLLHPAVSVQVRHGRWRLVPEGAVVLRRGPWTQLAPAEPLPRPPPLPAQLRHVWEALAAACPDEVTIAALARHLGVADGEAGRKTVSRAVYRLRRRLAAHRVPVALHADYQGAYRLLPLASPTTPPEEHA